MTTRGDAAERSRAGPGEMAMPPQRPQYITVSDDDDVVQGYLSQWRTDEWIYVEDDASRCFDWTDDHE